MVVAERVEQQCHRPAHKQYDTLSYPTPLKLEPWRIVLAIPLEPQRAHFHPKPSKSQQVLHKHRLTYSLTHSLTPCDPQTSQWGKVIPPNHIQSNLQLTIKKSSTGTDKLYITHSEWSGPDTFGASSGYTAKSTNLPFKRLPYNFCAVSLQPFTHPVCTPDGTIFDLTNIIPWLKKHGTNPVTGAQLSHKDLLKLHMAKNEDGEYCDPVTFKVFTDNTHIVAIRTSGNVFAWDTIERLNIKPKHWRDLVGDEQFTRKDIITLQDPQNLESRDMSEFKYLKDGTSTLTEEQAAERADPLSGINVAAMGSSAKILAAKAAVAKARAAKSSDPNHYSSRPGGKAPGALTRDGSSSSSGGNNSAGKNVPYNAARHTTGRAAASLTSTSLTPHTGAERALLSDEEYMLKPKRIKIKGYARISTNLGNLNIELHTDYAPKAVYNFVKLAQKGYYDGVRFHRNIRNFMVIPSLSLFPRN